MSTRHGRDSDHDISVHRTHPPRIDRLQLFRDQACDLGLAEINGSAAGHVQQPIESDEGLARSDVLTSEDPFLREASQETPSDKDGRSWNIKVGKAASIALTPL